MTMTILCLFQQHPFVKRPGPIASVAIQTIEMIPGESAFEPLKNWD